MGQRHEPRHDAHRGRVWALRVASRPRLRRRSPADRTALLHQLAGPRPRLSGHRQRQRLSCARGRVGLTLVAVAIAAGTVTGLHVERRLGMAAARGAERMLRAIVYFALPPVVFLNVAHLHFDTDLAGGMAVGWVAVAIVGWLCWLP